MHAKRNKYSDISRSKKNKYSAPCREAVANPGTLCAYSAVNELASRPVLENEQAVCDLIIIKKYRRK